LNQKPNQAVLRLLVAIGVAVLPFSSGVSMGDDITPATVNSRSTVDRESAPKSQPLKFSFEHAPWKEVLKWLAEQSDLSFSADVVPEGTFNYFDEDRTFTTNEAIDLVNSYLLIKGYTLVRKGKSLWILDLEDDVDKVLVRELLTETPLSELDQRGEYEISKTRFTLNLVDATAAEKQLTPLLSPVGSLVVIPMAKQILATETGGTLRSMRDILNLLEKSAAEDAQKKLHTFPLRIANADEVLQIARPLLGIAEDANAAEDGSIRISADPLGRTVFATGNPDKVQLVEQIVKQVDTSAGSGGSGGIVEPPQLMSHRISTTDPDAVLRVLQTLFVGDPVVRLEVDRGTGSVIAYARASQHRSIKATIEEMERNPERFAVISLSGTDPASATLLVEKLFGGTQNAPVVDGMLNPPQLVVRGTQAQIQQIRSLFQQMDDGPNVGRSRSGQRGRVRTFRISPEDLQGVLENLQRVWPKGRNPLRIVQPEGNEVLRTLRPREDFRRRDRFDEQPEPEPPIGSPESDRRDADPPQDSDELTPSETKVTQAVHIGRGAGGSSFPPLRSYLLAQNTEEINPADGHEAQPESPPVSDLPEILITPTPDGNVMISSDDLEALDALETLIESLAPSDSSNRRFNLAYLKHVEAETAKTLLTGILNGTTSSTTAPSAASFSTAPRGGVIGNMLQQGLPTTSAGVGVPHITADNRLNALYIYGTAAQIAVVKQLLDVIDTESGPEEVLTFPRPRFIPVFNTTAESVATVVRQLYATRIEGASPGGNNAQQQRGGGQFGEGFRGFGGPGGFGPGGFGPGGFGFGREGGDQGGGRSRGQNQQSAGNLPKMSLGVDTESNSLVVSAPGPLLKEVEGVVHELDRRAGEKPPESISIVTLKRTTPQSVRQALAVLGEMVETSSETPQSGINGNQNSGRDRDSGDNNFRRGDRNREFGRPQDSQENARNRFGGPEQSGNNQNFRRGDRQGEFQRGQFQQGPQNGGRRGGNGGR
jgi:type II secretory pathway component GspD/PulD (secretin)